VSQSNLINVNETIEYGNVVLNLLSYNVKFFKTSKDFVNLFERVLSRYSEYLSYSQDDSFLSFLNDSVYNNDYMVSDYINEEEYDVDDESICILNDEESEVKPCLDNMGNFIIGNYNIHCSGPYLCIEDMDEKLKYVYFMD